MAEFIPGGNQAEEALPLLNSHVAEIAAQVGIIVEPQPMVVHRLDQARRHFLERLPGGGRFHDWRAARWKGIGRGT